MVGLGPRNPMITAINAIEKRASAFCPDNAAIF
jgi:hypothetical protein